MQKIIEFTSEFDGTNRKALLIVPPDAGKEPLPLIIVPHAAGFSAEKTADYWKPRLAKRRAMAIFPFGHGRKLDLFSLGWRGQIADLAYMPRLLPTIGYPVDDKRIYAAGISMGGMELLLLAGSHPNLLSGVITFNALVDLSAWYYDPSANDPILREEIGGGPDEMPEAYAERSPINYSTTIVRTPTMMYWDPNDEIVHLQREKQSGFLYRKVKEIDPHAPIWERTHDKGHFWVNPRLALDWLLNEEWRNQW